MLSRVFAFFCTFFVLQEIAIHERKRKPPDPAVVEKPNTTKYRHTTNSQRKMTKNDRWFRFLYDDRAF
jgi:hypothetical protein